MKGFISEGQLALSLRSPISLIPYFIMARPRGSYGDGDVVLDSCTPLGMTTEHVAGPAVVQRGTSLVLEMARHRIQYDGGSVRCS